MTERNQRNFLVRLWLGFWRGLTAFRIAVFNILFLIVLALIIKFIFSPGGQIVVQEGTTLVIEPKGMMVEQYTGDPVERLINEALGQSVPETRLRDVVAALDRAREDDDIAQVLVRTDELWNVGPGIGKELARLFDEFRASGKPVIAHGGFLGQSQYFLASLADEIWLDTDGLVVLEGYGRFRSYFREGLEKLDVDINLFRVGEYKSAMEPYIRDDMSDEAREAAEYYMGSLWQEYLEQVAMNRGMPLEHLARIVDSQPELLEAANGDSAAMALEQGLVDRLVSRPEVRAELARTGHPDDDTGFRQISFQDYLQVPERPAVGEDKVGVIVAQGVILDGEHPPGSIGSDTVSRLIREAGKDDSIKAVVLRVDSPGGSAFGSEVIRRELMALREAGKPVVVSMGNLAASGGYWIAMGADEVWAHPSTITGSIGIFGMIPTFQNTLAKIGVYNDGVGTTPLAGAFQPGRELPDEAGRMLQSIIENGYGDFIDLVAEHRQMSFEEVDEVARGRVWSGSQALDRGLVDQLGNLDDAVAAAARQAGLGDDFEKVYVERKLGAFESFVMEMTGQTLARLDVKIESGMYGLLPRTTRARIEQDLRLLKETAEARRPSVMAHCLCGVPD